MPRASWNFIGNQTVSFPSITEQNIITKLLDDTTNRIDGVASKTLKTIELLSELKSSLISNVVTGKVKV